MMKQPSILPTLQKKDTITEKMMNLSSNMLKSIGSSLIGNGVEKVRSSKRHWLFKATLLVNNRKVNTINPYIVVQHIEKEPTELNIAILSQLNPWIRTTAVIEWVCIGTIDIEDQPSSTLIQRHHYVRTN
jgi:hypothetical protein